MPKHPINAPVCKYFYAYYPKKVYYSHKVKRKQKCFNTFFSLDVAGNVSELFFSEYTLNTKIYHKECIKMYLIL